MGTVHPASFQSKTFRRGKILTFTIDYLWEADMVDMSKLTCENDGYKFLLVAIDTFSKFAWVQRLKNKTGPEILRAFSTILQQSKRKPQKLRTEFTNAPLQNLLKNRIFIFIWQELKRKLPFVKGITVH